MSKKNLSTVATDVIDAYGITATNVINATRYGGERLIGFVDTRIASAVKRGESVYGKGIRSNLIDSQKRVSGYSVKGLHLGTEGAQRAVGVTVDLATQGVGFFAANAGRFDRAANLNALETLNRVAMPAAQLVSKMADRLEEGSTELVKRVAGKPLAAKAVATRKLSATTRKAAAARKQATQTASRQVGKAVAEGKKISRTATKRVSKAVAKTATQTSNAARRVARKARATAAAA